MSDKGEVKRQPKMGSPGDRRGFIIKLAAGAGALAVGPTFRHAKVFADPKNPQRAPRQASEEQQRAETSAEVRAFLGHVRSGARVGDRWVVERVKGPHMGAIAVQLRAEDGSRFQVDVLRRDAAPNAPQPIARTDSLDLFLANRGDGNRRTLEEHGLGLMALAQQLRQREQAGARPPRLLSFSDRRARHPIGNYLLA